jgi:16S rRNA pseudouridine516 synthase
VRIDALLSRYGYCSRSEARAWVKTGRVSVRGAQVRNVAEKADPANVFIDGKLIEHPAGILALMHKPQGYVCSHDPGEGPAIYDLLPEQWLRRNPPVTTIGRLDKDTTGVLLVTDDGDRVHRWTSPRHKVAKVYEVTVDADLPPNLPTLFASGDLLLEGESKPCLPAKIELLSLREARVEIYEGRYHQVKRMFASQGCNVTRLHRSAFGAFTVSDLQPGEWRILSAEEIARAESGSDGAGH